VYFAPTREVRDWYNQQQDGGNLQKRYICEVEGNIMCERTAEKHPAGVSLISRVAPPKDFYLHEVETLDGRVALMELLPEAMQACVIDAPDALDGMTCSYPIMHHVERDDRMQVVVQAMDKYLGRSRLHQVKTVLLPISYDIQTQRTVCYAVIQQGIRHQIRAHCGALGYPIVGDVIYGRKKAGGGKL
jgi:hypothetical protein